MNKDLENFEGEKAPDVMAVILTLVFLAYTAWSLTGCTVHFGIDYTGKTDKSNVSESPNFRRGQ